MKLGQRTGALLAASVLLAAAGCSTKSTDTASSGSSGSGDIKTGRGVEGDVITLGVLTDLTGVFASLGADITNANQLYWKKQNAGDKVCGGKYTVKLNVKDHGYVPATGVQLYGSIKDDVLAMQQTLGSPINTALGEQYTADNQVNLPSAWARNLTEVASNGIVGATYDVEMTNGLSYALENGLIKEGAKLGHIYFEGEYGANGLAGSKYFAGKHGMTVVEAKIKSSDQDMSPIITKFKAAGINALVLTVAPGQTASAAGAAATQGLDIPIIGNNPVFAPGLLKGPAAPVLKKNLIVASPINTFDKHPDLLAEYKAGFPDAVPSLGVLFGFGMSDVMRQIIEKACDDGDLTPEGMVKAKSELKAIDTGNIIVPLDFSQVGKSPSLDSFIVQPADVPGGAKALTDAVESKDAAGLS